MANRTDWPQAQMAEFLFGHFQPAVPLAGEQPAKALQRHSRSPSPPLRLQPACFRAVWAVPAVHQKELFQSNTSLPLSPTLQTGPRILPPAPPDTVGLPLQRDS